MQNITQIIQEAVQNLFNEQVTVELTRTDEQFGDYASNVALRLSKKVNQNPREIAQKIVDVLKHDSIEKLEIAGPGFINITLTNSALQQMAMAEPAKSLQNQVVVAEYSDPNPFKVLHAGHLYTSVTGDAIANLLEKAGAVVHRVNFGGDVGLHVAKTLWGITQELGGELPEKLAEIPEQTRSDWMASCYQKGNTAYEEVEEAKAEITAINKRVYVFHSEEDRTSPLAQIYWTCREWSYTYFDAFYARIGSKFEKYYPESQTAPLGLEIVRKHIGDVYEESDGAVVFKGEKYGLHTRVFINSNGLPTYEAKDVGLAVKKWNDYSFDKSVIITGNDIVEYMKVVMKSIEGFLPEATKRTTHLTHGQVKLAGGIKMSSRKGNFLRAVDVLQAASEANKLANNQEDAQVSLGAVKYAFLKQRMGGDIVYDPNESVSLQGNSGPYLQYAHARACSILEKSTLGRNTEPSKDIDQAERSMLRKISEYSEVVEKATLELMPHHICTYLYELAQSFNRFYEHNRVIDDPREEQRIQVMSIYTNTLKNGLELLGIHAPQKM